MSSKSDSVATARFALQQQTAERELCCEARMVDNDDTQDEPTQPVRPEPGEVTADVAAFYRKLAEVQVECDELGAALERRDRIGVEIAAGDLASVWLVAKSALRIVEACASSDREQAWIAQLALRASHQVLTHLFRRALAEISRWGSDAPRLHGVLGRLSATLGLPVVYDARRTASDRS